VVFSDQAGRRDSLDQARLWVALQKRLQLDEPLEFREEMTDECSRARVPAVVAGEGRPATAAMLAAHGFSNGEIAGALGVEARTISQYLSDFQKGVR
jgi:plasmid maintenance system antidote protein VapI